MTSKPSSDIAEAHRLHQAGDLAEARTLYQRALDAAPAENHPNAVAAMHGLGLIALDLNRPAEALPLLARCVAVAPEDPVYRMSLGLALLAADQTEDAAGHFLAAANQAPQLADPRAHLARALGKLGRHGQALEVLTATVEHFPDRADLWALKANAERRLKQRTTAAASLRKAAHLDPGDPGILSALAAVLRETGETDEAIAFYRKALALAPKSDAAARGLALLLTAEERPEEAIPLYRSILGRAPDDTDALTNLGVALLATGDSRAAEAAYRRALEAAPDNAEAHYNLAWLLLLTGRWTEGWEHYEWRWRLAHFSSRVRGFRDVVWDGSPIAGTLLVHAEQGLGDTIQFARFLAAAKIRCGRVQFECARPLARLFRELGAGLADDIIAVGEPIKPFDRHLPLMSLARLFAPSPDAVSGRPYLAAPSAIPLRLRLPRTGNRKVGLVWAGSPDNKIDRRRSLPARALIPLTTIDGVDFVSLQVGPQADQAGDLGPRVVFDCNGKVNDFADTAAVVQQLDLVIGVDTAVIHLAGAMGKAVWLMLPFMPDYRWLLGRDDSPWYESIRLFRQENPGAWTDVVAKLSAALTRWKAING